MQEDFIQLNRTFTPYVIDRDVEEAGTSSYMGGSSYGESLEWEQILNHGRVVILGEPGSGKTWELKAQAKLLREQSQAAFFLPIEQLAQGELDKQLDPDNERRFNEWKNSEAKGYFFLDAVDEARLKTHAAFETAVANFARSLGAATNRASVVVSSRISEWRGDADNLLVSRYLPPLPKKAREALSTGMVGGSYQEEDEEAEVDGEDDTHGPEREEDDNKSRLSVVVLAPLTETQVRKLAERKISDSEEFVDAVDRRDAWHFARRPRDVVNLLAYWTAFRQLGTLTQLLDFDITRKLEEDNERRKEDPLSKTQARDGAESLAAATILSRRGTFLLPYEDADRGLSYTSVDPRSVLTRWRHAEIRALLGRPVFDEAAYSRVRFYHRSAAEYLASCYFYRLAKANLPLATLRGYFFRASHGQIVVPPSLAPVAAWLAGRLPTIRQELMKRDPDVLLRHGDPSCIPLPERIDLLKRVAESAEVRQDSVDKAQLRRLSHPDLAPTVNELLSQKSTTDATRELLLDLVRHGHLKACAQAVFDISISGSEVLYIRHRAIRTLKEVGGDELLRKLGESALREARISVGHATALCRSLYPQTFDEKALETLLRISESPSEYSFLSLDHELESAVHLLVPERLLSFIETINRLIRERLSSTVSGATQPNESLWLYSPLVQAVRRVMRTDASVEKAATVAEAIELLGAVRKRGSYHDEDKPLQEEDFGHNVEVRRQLFWRRVHARRRDGRDINIWSLLSHSSVWYLTENDVHWLLDETSSAENDSDKIDAFRVALQLQTSRGKGLGQAARRIRDIARTDRRLREVYKQEVRTLAKRAAITFHSVARSVRLRGLITRAKNRLSRAGVRVRVLSQVVLHFRALKSEGPFWLLNNLVSASSEREVLHRFEEFRVDRIDKRFGRLIGTAARQGFKVFWRKWTPPLPGTKLGTSYHGTRIALIGLSVEFDEEPTPKLTEEEVRTAVHHALYELNAFPSWLPRLVTSHPNIVRSVFRKQIEAEFTFTKEATHVSGLLNDLLYSTSDTFQRISAADLLDVLTTSEPQNLVILSMAVELLARQEQKYRDALAALAPGRAMKAAESGDASRLVLWLSVWLQLDALPALDFFQDRINADLANADQFVISVASSLRADRRRSVAIPNPSYRQLAALRRLVPLLYRYVRLEKDIEHVGVYSPSERDDAESFRSAALRTLIDTDDRDGYQALKELANDPALKAISDLLLSYAAERQKSDADKSTIWQPEEVAILVDRFEREPSTPEDLFEVVCGRLGDMRDDAENGDFSLRGCFEESEPEEMFQKLIAGWLQEASRGVYEVARETEVIAFKMPDIRIFKPGVGIVTIEIKVANKWSYNQLRNDALEKQLIGQYMRMRRSRHGILLLVNLKKKRWIAAKGSELDFKELVKKLGEEAEQLVKTRERGERVKVLGFDLSK